MHAPARSSSRSRGTDGGDGVAVAAAAAASPSGSPVRRTSSRRLLTRTSPLPCCSCRPAVRRRLEAVYGFARLVDDAGDLHVEGIARRSSTGSRPISTAPSTVERSTRCCSGSRAVGELSLPREPFPRLIEANRQDQGCRATRRGPSWPRTASCRRIRSASSCSTSSGRRRRSGSRWSDAVCTGLQLAEHWQDVGEDHARGGIYLPEEDLTRFGVTEADLAAAVPSDAFRRCWRSRSSVRGAARRGAPLVRSLAGRCRLAIAAYVGGGRGGARRGRAAAVRRAAGPAGRGEARRVRRRCARSRSHGRDDLRAGIRRCREVTRSSATNFYHGMRLLPPARRARHVRGLRLCAPHRRHRGRARSRTTRSSRRSSRLGVTCATRLAARRRLRARRASRRLRSATRSRATR